MTIPSCCAVFPLNVGPVNVRFIAQRDSSVEDLKPELSQFFTKCYEVTVSPEEQTWNVADLTVPLISLGEEGAEDDSAPRRRACCPIDLRVTLGDAAAARLGEKLASLASARQRACAAAALARFGVKGEIDALLDGLAGLYVARRGLALPEDVAALCTARADLTARQKHAVRFSSTVDVRDAAQTNSSTGISTHTNLLTRFDALGAAWEWRIDHGHIDGFEYERAELAREGAVVLQLDYDEDKPSATAKRAWRPASDELAAVADAAGMPLDDLLVCLQCVLGESDQIWPTKHGFSWTEPCALSAEPVFASPILTPEKMSHGWWATPKSRR